MHSPEMRNPATLASDRANSQGSLNTEDSKAAALAFQALKLRRLFSFCQATAYAIATLAFAGGPR